MKPLQASVAALALICAVVTTTDDRASAQVKVQGTTLRGRIVRVPAAGEYVVQTSAGKEITLYSTPQTVYRLGNRVVTAKDLRVGNDITFVYELRDDRYHAGEIVIGSAEATPAGQELRGRITRAAANPNHLVLTTSDGKEILLYLDVNMEVSVRVQDVNGKRQLVALSAAQAANTATAEPIKTEGTIVRVGTKANQYEFIVRTRDGKEVILLPGPKAVYRIDDRDVRIEDIQEGQPVTVIYETNNRRNLVRSIIGRRK